MRSSGSPHAAGLIGQRNDTIDGLGRQRRNARGPGLVAGEPRDPLMHETLLPAPHNSLALADSAHDGGGAVVVGGQSDDPRPPHVLLRTVAIPDDRLQAHPICRRNRDGNSFAHHQQSHETKPSETPFGLFRQVHSTRLRGLGAVTRRAPEEMRSAWCGRPAKSANSLISFTEQNNVKRGWAQGLINKVVSRIMLWIGASR